MIGVTDLQRVLRSGVYDDSGTCALVQASLNGDDVELVFEVDPGTDPRQVQRWNVTAHDVVDRRLALGWLSGLSFVDDPAHRLLSPFVEDAADLTFTGRPVSVDALLGALYRAHMRWAEGWFSFQAFCRHDPDLLAGGYGQLADGPRSLMHEFAEVLRKHNMVPAVVAHPAAFSVNGTPIYKPEHPLVALVFDAYNLSNDLSFVIARDFSARLVEETPAPECSLDN